MTNQQLEQLEKYKRLLEKGEEQLDGGQEVSPVKRNTDKQQIQIELTQGPRQWMMEQQ